MTPMSAKTGCTQRIPPRSAPRHWARDEGG